MNSSSTFPPQRWGVLPTRAFAEVAFRYDGWPRAVLVVLVLAFAFVTQGLLERYIRSPSPLMNVTEAERLHVMLAPGPEEQAALDRRSLRGAYGLMVLFGLTGAFSLWQAGVSHRREARYEQQRIEVEKSREQIEKFRKEYEQRRKAAAASPKGRP